MIRPRLESASMVWLPNKKKGIKKLERIQTNLVPEISSMEYENRLKEMELPMLEQRRERGDMITTYKFVNKIDKVDKNDLLTARLRGLR